MDLIKESLLENIDFDNTIQIYSQIKEKIP